jgi:hypothetical protein
MTKVETPFSESSRNAYAYTKLPGRVRSLSRNKNPVFFTVQGYLDGKRADKDFEAYRESRNSTKNLYLSRKKQRKQVEEVKKKSILDVKEGYNSQEKVNMGNILFRHIHRTFSREKIKKGTLLTN